MGVKISKHRVKIDVQDYILHFAVDHIFDRHAKWITSGESHGLLTCDIQERDGVDGCGGRTATTMSAIRSLGGWERQPKLLILGNHTLRRSAGNNLTVIEQQSAIAETLNRTQVV